MSEAVDNSKKPSAAMERLSVNQWTVRAWGVRELADGCGRHGIGAVGLWREPVAEFGLQRSAKVVRDAAWSYIETGVLHVIGQEAQQLATGQPDSASYVLGQLQAENSVVQAHLSSS